MATASSSAVGINVQFGQKRTTIYVSKKDKVNSVVVKAVEELGLDKSKTYALLHEGTVLPYDTTAEVAIVPARATVFFLQLTTEKVIKSTAGKVNLEDVNNVIKDDKYGYCKKCKGLVELRALLACATCKQDTVALTKEIDYFDDQSLMDARGMCAICNTECRPSITYQCKNCLESASFLRLVRNNLFQLPCMKCGKKEDIIFRFMCSSYHTLCIKCFDGYCSIMLSRNKFRNFAEAGFSIPCPGPGDDCPDTPVCDPHHFYLVGEEDAFYRKHSEEAWKQWKPPGDNIICEKCEMEVDLTKGQDKKVPSPNVPEEATVSGSAWFKNLKKKFARAPPAPPTPQTRKMVSCFKCQQEFCCVCKNIWHKGDCVIINEEEIKEFTIEQGRADASKWPS